MYIGLAIAFLGVCIYLASLFKKSSAKEIEEEKESKYKDCDIEYLPIVNKYRPRYKGHQIYQLNSGQWQFNNPYVIGSLFSTKEAAQAHLDLFLEQRGITSQIIKLC